jgi:hypothetical protein
MILIFKKYQLKAETKAKYVKGIICQSACIDIIVVNFNTTPSQFQLKFRIGLFTL